MTDLTEAVAACRQEADHQLLPEGLSTPPAERLGKSQGAGKEWWRKKGRVSLDEATAGFKYFRLVPPEGSEYSRTVGGDQGAHHYTESPRIPESAMPGENTSIPRVSLAPSIWHGLAGLAGGLTADELRGDHDAQQDVGGKAHDWHVYGVRANHPGILPNEHVQQHVPDAHLTGEVWGTQPTTMEHIGTLGGDYAPGDQNYRYHLWMVPGKGFAKSMIQPLGKSERQKNTRQVVSIAAYHDGKILMGLRGDTRKWCMPGGHLEPDETPARAAVRELLEETGLKALTLERLGSAIAGRNGNVQVHSYRADVDGSPDASNDPDAEFIKFRWVDPDDLPEEILAALYNPKDVTLQLLGAQPKSLELSKASLAEIMARTQALAQHMRTLADSGAATHVFPHRMGGHVLVARDPSKPGKWRATRIDASGEPLGHIEADDQHQAIKHANSYGADVLALQPFQKSAELWLAKATRPGDFKSIVKATTPEGKRFVDHKTQLHAHPLSISPGVEHYNNEVLSGAKTYVPKPGKASEGVSRKVIFQTTARPQGDMFAPTPHGMDVQYMVKPYHERVVKRVGAWQKYPIQGWAEMAHQALYHAGGIGHLHQKVHVAEHEMEDAQGRKSVEPALVVHMEKGLKPASDVRNIDANMGEQPSQDAMKISMMDFLTNNLDRHGGNLMMKTEELPQRHGEPNWYGPPTKVHQVLAIDHSRSFQYLNNHHHKWVNATETAWGRSPKTGSLEDSPRAYMFGNARGRPSTSLLLRRPETYQDKLEFLNKLAKPTFDWWEKASPKIKAAMDEQVGHIKDPEARDHVRRNFMERARYLDQRANLGIDNYGTDWYDDPVSMYRPSEKTDEEVVDERKAAAVAEFNREEAERKAKVG